MDKFDTLYMDMAVRVSKMSYAIRKKVGAILVKDNNIISFGWNGTPSNFDNKCEDENNNTIPELIHAEFNIIAKAAKMGICINNSTLYVTLSPCFECSKLLIQSGIKKIIYLEKYRINEAIAFLKKANIEVIRYEV